MKKIALLLCMLSSITIAKHYQTSLFQQNNINIKQSHVKTNNKAFYKALKYSLDHFKTENPYYKRLTKGTILDNTIISPQETHQTLAFTIDAIQEDLTNKKSLRILDPTFLEKHFTFIRWNCDTKESKKHNVCIPTWYDDGKLIDGKIKLTSYAVFKTKASYHKTKKCLHALYKIKSKEFKKNLRCTYTKRDVLNGVLEHKRFNKHVEPLVWVSRRGLEEALMQGSIIAIMPDGKQRLFNIQISNGIKYDKAIKYRWLQEKYWYFDEMKTNHKRQRRLRQLVTLGGAAFAGDIDNLGIGKIIALKYKNPITKRHELHLGVLADKGGAFSNNLYQLDLFAGIFNTKKEFNQHIRQFPPSVEAYILKKKG